jgi:hypothetical protein
MLADRTLRLAADDAPFRPSSRCRIRVSWLCVHSHLVGALAHGALGHWLGGLLGLRSLASRGRADLASAGWLAVAVALGSAVGAVSPTLPMMPPRLSAATAVMIRAGHPNRLGFFGCC